MLSAVAQYFLKVGMNKLTNDFSFSVVMQNIPLWGGLFCYGLSMVFWLFVLSRLELSKAYPMVSLGYVFTLILGYFYLGESINTYKIIGVFFIIIGVMFIAKM